MKKIIILLMLGICTTAFTQDVGKINIYLNKQKLAAGELQTFEFDYITSGQGKKKGVIGVVLVNAPQAELWKVLMDWDSMSEYVPGVTQHKTRYVVKSAKDGSPLESLIEARLKTAGILSIIYTLRVKFDGEKLVQEWSFLSDNETEELNKEKNLGLNKASFGLKNISGFQYIESYSETGKCVFYYAPVVEISIPLPGFVEKAITGKTLSDFMIAVKKRAESGAGKKNNKKN